MTPATTPPTTTPPTTTPPGGDAPVSPSGTALTGGRLTAVRLGAEVLDELRAIVREPTALFFSVVMPVGFFAMFAGIFGGQQTGGLPAATLMLGTFGTYAVVAVAMFTPGIGLAEARDRGWLRMLRVSAVPVPVTLGAKILATLPYSVLVMSLITAVTALYGDLQIAAGTWFALLAALVIGTLPFAFLSLAIGSLASPNATTAILNAVLMPSAVASGLWFPLEILPRFVQQLAPALPTYHLSQLGQGIIVGTPAADLVGHLAFLVATAAATAALAVVAYRRSPAS